MTFSIPSEIFSLYREVCDELINNTNVGKQCTLYYHPTVAECPNCIFDSFTNKSAGVYKAGGPLQFSAGLCPWCNGEGLKETEVTENINLRLYWNRRDWLKTGVSVNIPDADLMTIGFIADMPKCQQALYVRIISEQSNYAFWDFTLASEPQPHGFGKQYYFMAFWKRK